MNERNTDELIELNALSRRHRAPLPPNHGARWTDDLDAEIVAAYRTGASVAELAKEQERTRGAISSRLALLGLVERKGPKADARYLEYFERATFVLGAFGHRGHIRVARQLLIEASVDSALARMRAGLHRLLRKYGSAVPPERGYHETQTVGWLTLVSAAVRRSPGEHFARFAEQHPALFDAAALFEHYSAERLFSEDARTNFIAPDLRPLPVGQLHASRPSSTFEDAQSQSR